MHKLLVSLVALVLIAGLWLIFAPREVEGLIIKASVSTSEEQSARRLRLIANEESMQAQQVPSSREAAFLVFLSMLSGSKR